MLYMMELETRWRRYFIIITKEEWADHPNKDYYLDLLREQYNYYCDSEYALKTLEEFKESYMDDILVYELNSSKVYDDDYKRPTLHTLG